MVGMRERGGSLWLYGEFGIKSDKKVWCVIGSFFVGDDADRHYQYREATSNVKKGSISAWKMVAEPYRKIPLIPSIHHKSGVVKSRQSIASSQQKLSNDTFLT